jgi:hypothetical protein
MSLNLNKPITPKSMNITPMAITIFPNISTYSFLRLALSRMKKVIKITLINPNRVQMSA